MSDQMKEAREFIKRHRGYQRGEISSPIRSFDDWQTEGEETSGFLGAGGMDPTGSASPLDISIDNDSRTPIKFL
ncbi:MULTISPECIES: hypothetical protein [unclassified Streptomyces]|uniref:hypothetical protein n=1 Tax=unclassified Streptomyces TaxID=2593676 RepID=UPI002E808076|nr:hypothetical protein [Streptomyces sp. NBC_00569]WUB95147.1 hypothetical protein OHO83_24110 [Streptomyces sp. NBC_00569]